MSRILTRFFKIASAGHDSPTPGAAFADLLLRAFAGLSLAFAHGLGKMPPREEFVAMVDSMGLPAPTLFAWLAGFGEFIGGLLLALGFITRFGAVCVLATLIGAIHYHLRAGDGFAVMEFAMLYIAIAVYYLLAGADRYSVDAGLRRGLRGER